jgi:hypothetical protein
MNLASTKQWIQTFKAKRAGAVAAELPESLQACGMDAALGVDRSVLSEISQFAASGEGRSKGSVLEAAWAARRLNGRSVI